MTTAIQDLPANYNAQSSQDAFAIYEGERLVGTITRSGKNAAWSPIFHPQGEGAPISAYVEASWDLQETVSNLLRADLTNKVGLMAKYPLVRLTEKGVARVLNGAAGMVFPVDKFTVGVSGAVAHVRDYRYQGTVRDFQTWSIGAEGYEVMA